LIGVIRFEIAQAISDVPCITEQPDVTLSQYIVEVEDNVSRAPEPIDACLLRVEQRRPWRRDAVRLRTALRAESRFRDPEAATVFIRLTPVIHIGNLSKLRRFRAVRVNRDT
jgi:hypothetical protein